MSGGFDAGEDTAEEEKLEMYNAAEMKGEN
jgi:hypothetical protein